MIDRTHLFAFRTTQDFIHQFDRICDQLGHKRSEVARYFLNRFINEHHNNPDSTTRTRKDLY
jgi:antitoxin component of RelBE/YafQ-DinJ toxin-antitoxin module